MDNEEYQKLDNDEKKKALIARIAQETQSVKDYAALKAHCKGGTTSAREQLDKASKELLSAISKHGQAQINLRACENMLKELGGNESEDV